MNPYALPCRRHHGPEEPMPARALPPGMGRRRTAAFLALFLLAVAPPAASSGAPPDPSGGGAEAGEPGTYFLVRHAEKERDGPRAPALTEEGQRRARELVHALGSAGLQAIYATPWRRTRSTAEPLAQALGLEVKIVDTSGDYAARMAGILLEEHPGQRVLVVGHSNTTPDLARALGAADVPEIPDHQYDDLWLVTVGAPPANPVPAGAESGGASEPGRLARVSLLRLGYGDPPPRLVPEAPVPGHR